MNCTPGKLRLLFALCALAGLAGLGLTQTQRFLALRIETALRELGGGRAKVAVVSGSLLEGLTIHDLEFASDLPGETRVAVKLPRVQAIYDLPATLLRGRNAAPSTVRLEAPFLEIERRGPAVELHKLVRLLALLREELPETPVTISRGTLVLGGEFPWKRAQRIAIEDAFIEWSGIGLACRAALVWEGVRVAIHGSYDPVSGLGHFRWTGDRAGSLPGVEVATLLAEIGLAAPSELLHPVAFSGELKSEGELFLRTRAPDGSGEALRWVPFVLDRVPPFFVAWSAAARVDRCQLATPWTGADPIPVETLTVAWPSGAPGAFLAETGLMGGRVKAHGKLEWPLVRRPGVTIEFAGLRPPALASVSPEARASGTVNLGAAQPFPFQARVSRLRVARLAADVEAELAGTISTAAIDITQLALRSGRARATGRGRVLLPALEFEAHVDAEDLPAEWLGQAVGVRAVSGKGLRGSVFAKGRVWPWTLVEGRFSAHALALTVAGMSAGDIRAAGRFTENRLELESFEGMGQAQLFKSIRLSGVLVPGKMPELTGHVRGLKLEAFAPGVKGTGDAEIQLAGGRHEVHARIRDLAIPSMDLRVPQAGLDLVPRGKSETLSLSLPGKGRLEAAVVWGAGNARAVQAAGSVTLPDISFLLAPGGFLRGGRAAASFRLTAAADRLPELEFTIVDLNLATQRGPLVADGPVSGAVKQGRLVFAPSRIRLAGGSVAFEGVAGMSDRNWDFKLDTHDLPIHLSAILGPGVLSGRLFSSFQLSGTLARPTVVAQVDLAKPMLGSAQGGARRVLERVRGKLVYRAGELSLDRLVLMHGKQECVLTGRVPVHLALAPFAAGWGKGPLDLRFVFPPTPLSVASLLVPWVPAAAEGSFQADVSLGGTPRAPRVQGLLEATASRLVVPGLALPLTAATARVVFTDNRAELRYLDGRLAGARLAGTGRATFGDGWNVEGGMDLTLSDLRVAQRNLTLEGVQARARLEKAGGKLDFDATFTVDKGILDLAFFDGTGTSSFFDSLPASFTYRIGGSTRGNFWVRSSAVNAELEGALELKGRGAERTVGGELSAVRGQLLFQGHRFNVEQGTVAFRTPAVADPSLFPWQQRPRAEERRPGSVPYISARGTQEIGKTVITMEVTGPAEHMNFNLRSLPPHTEDEILAILATRSDSEIAAVTGQEDLVGKMITAPIAQRFDEQFLNRPVGAAVRKATGLDEFRIDSNLLQRDRNVSLTPQISAGKYLSKNIFLSIDGRVGGESQPLEHLGLQYKLERNLAFTLDKSLETTILNENLSKSLRPEETKVGMEYRLRW